MRRCGSILFVSISILFSCEKSEPLKTVSDTNWRQYYGAGTSNKYSVLDQITRSNVTELKVAWEYDIPRTEDQAEIKCNPLIIDGVLYGNTASNLVALDAKTGEEIWYLDWDNYELNDRQHGSRGLLYWEGNDEQRLFVVQARHLYAVNAATGELIASFGEGGRIPYNTGLGVDETKMVRLTTPGVIYEDLIISGSFVSEHLPSAPGHIRAFSAIDGQMKWIFHTIPEPGEFGYETWPENAYKEVGGANSWGGISLDDERGIAYVPTGSAAYDFYGANRHGKNLFANSLIALDARTGKRIWHYQIVHHDLWDRDLPCAPNLLTVNHNGVDIDAVAQPTKHGFVFLFNRETGEPLFEINEVPVPPSTIPGEEAWPTQPIPEKPPPFSRTVFRNEHIAEWPPEIKNQIKEQLAYYSTEIFTPPDTIGIVLQPGIAGGVNWGGAAIDEPSATMVVNAVELPHILKLVDRHKEFNELSLEGSSLYKAYCSSCHGENLKGAHYIPGLENIETKFDRREISEIIEQGRGSMPANSHLEEDEINAITAYLLKEPFNFGRKKNRPWSRLQAMGSRFTITGFEDFEVEGDLPPIKPPWGTLTAIDLNEGTIKWQIPLGINKEIDEPGREVTGAENSGGSVITKGGLIFIAATHDDMIRAFDIDNGEMLWSYDLGGEGQATPSIYAIDGIQYLVIAVSNTSGDSDFVGKYVAFALEE